MFITQKKFQTRTKKMFVKKIKDANLFNKNVIKNLRNKNALFTVNDIEDIL